MNKKIINGSHGYSFRVKTDSPLELIPGTYFGVKKPGSTYFDDHLCYGDTKQFEYDLNGKKLLWYYNCNDGKIRSKTYFFDTMEDLQNLVSALEEARDSQLNTPLGRTFGFAPIVNITKIPGQKTPRGISGTNQMVTLITIGVFLAFILGMIFFASIF